jgi:hypothetical protein
VLSTAVTLLVIAFRAHVNRDFDAQIKQITRLRIRRLAARRPLLSSSWRLPSPWRAHAAQLDRPSARPATGVIASNTLMRTHQFTSVPDAATAGCRVVFCFFLPQGDRSAAKPLAKFFFDFVGVTVGSAIGASAVAAVDADDVVLAAETPDTPPDDARCSVGSLGGASAAPSTVCV